jgi:hypothetical protein
MTFDFIADINKFLIVLSAHLHIVKKGIVVNGCDLFYRFLPRIRSVLQSLPGVSNAFAIRTRRSFNNDKESAITCIYKKNADLSSINQRL